MKIIILVIEGTVEDTLVQWIATVLLLFSLKGKADRSEWEYAFLGYIECTRLSNGIDKKLGFVCLTWSADDLGHTKREDDNKEISVGQWFGLEQLRTIRGVVLVGRSNKRKKLFDIATAWHLHRSLQQQKGVWTQTCYNRVHSIEIKWKSPSCVLFYPKYLAYVYGATYAMQGWSEFAAKKVIIPCNVWHKKVQNFGNTKHASLPVLCTTEV